MKLLDVDTIVWRLGYMAFRKEVGYINIWVGRVIILEVSDHTRRYMRFARIKVEMAWINL